MTRIGVFICHCGVNIAGTVDVKRVVEELRAQRAERAALDVACVADYQYMCSDPGQALLVDAIQREHLDGVVVAACSPSMHEVTFRKAAQRGGLNPYRCEIANIREQNSWVHQADPEAATRKAVEVIRSMVAKVGSNEPLAPLTLPVVKRALVIGGGLAGLVAALDVADAGYPVVLVERESTLGGNVARLGSLYVASGSASGPEPLATPPLTPALSPQGEGARLSPSPWGERAGVRGGVARARIDAVRSHPNVQVWTDTVVDHVGGYVGNFTVTLRPKGPTEGAALPQFDVGAIVVATGYGLYDKARLGEYGGGRCTDVIDGLQLEDMLRPDGPTGGRILRPSDGKPPREVVWIQCAGSRDPELHRPYCSKICCMYVAKQAMCYKRQAPDGQAFVFYIDIRSQGKGYEEFVQQAMEDDHVLYVRGKVSRVFEEDGRVRVWGVDTLSGRSVEVEADLVVLATAVAPADGAADLAKLLRAAVDENGFFAEAHPKMRPVESLTAGVFLAGAAQFPKDIPETVAQASGAAAKVLSLFAQREMVQEPTVAWVDEEICSGCGVCLDVCPYDARAMHAWRPVATVNAALCQGCGACVVCCPNKATQVRNFTTRQVLDMLEEFL